MYNLQTAKQEIEQVAKHTSALTEYVMSLGERVQAGESHAAEMNDLKSILLKEIDAKFADLERKVFGDQTATDHPSAVAELGHKVAGLLHVNVSTPAPAPTHGSNEHHPEHYQHEHQSH